MPARPAVCLHLDAMCQKALLLHLGGLPVTRLLPLGSHCRAKGPEPEDAWQPMDMIATALSSFEMGACVGGSSSGMHSRQQMACDSGTSPPPLSCKAIAFTLRPIHIGAQPASGEEAKSSSFLLIDGVHSQGSIVEETLTGACQSILTQEPSLS